MMRGLLLCVLILIMAAPSTATPADEGYPKVLTYTSGIGELPEGTQDSLSWYDVLVCVDRPERIESLRAKNPGQRYLWVLMPQYVHPMDEPDPWWLPDTLWSIKRLMTVYAAENDWYLRDTEGEPIIHWDHLVLNWTEHCPVGTYGTSKGMRVSEWMASVALPTIALSGRYWDPWHWDSQTAYNGYMFEILADCLGSYGWEIFADADPDGDGEAEGVYNSCSMGGSEDPLSVLFRAENEIFYDRLMAAFPQEFVFLINENNRYIGPWWMTKLSGMKLENWMRERSNPSWTDWWDWFYGKTPPWQPGENWGAGYAWTESEFDKPVPDHLKGWDLSFIQVWEEDDFPEDENLRQMRWGLGTSMLGDGYFCYTHDQRYPLWQPEFDWDFGEPLEDFRGELYGLDTLYVRFFEQGMVEVNPNEGVVHAVPVHDSRFSFWLTVNDLAVNAIGDKIAAVRWTAPDGDYNQADGYELRYATFPLGIENWEEATSYVGNPVTALPGTLVFREVDDLTPGETYYFGVRTRISGRLEPFVSNVVSVTMELPTDTIPPEMIDDLHLVDAATTWLDLGWTATGDDGTVGVATSYALRYIPGEEIVTEEDWDRATGATDLPQPEPSGIPETYRLTDLQEGTTYGIAIRALDEKGNISALHPPFSASTETPPPPDTVAPAVIDDLHLTGAATDWLDLAWTATGDDGTVGVATSYALRYLPDEAIATEEDWDRAVAATGLPQPEPPGTPENYRLTDLEAGTIYGIAIRALDEAANISALHTMFFAATEQPPPPDTIPPEVIDDLHLVDAGTDWVDLGWTSTGDDGEMGVATTYALRFLPNEEIAAERDWEVATEASGLPDPQPAGTAENYRLSGLQAGTTYGIAIRALDEEANISALHPPFSCTTSPPPPPDTIAPAGIDDLAGEPGGAGTILLTWSAPGDDDWEGRADRYEIRLLPDAVIEDESDWSEADPAPIDPFDPAPPYATENLEISSLVAGAWYGVAIRALDEADNLAPLSNPLLVEAGEELPPEEDVVPPGAINDLTVTFTGETSAAFIWTATGDDGEEGTAAQYVLRLALGHAIDTEEAWQEAESPEGLDLPAPAPAGTPQAGTLSDLQPGQLYGLALRASDEAGNLSPLGTPVTFETSEEEVLDEVPPDKIDDLHAAAADTVSILLRWSAPADAGESGQAALYHLRIAADGTYDADVWELGQPVEGLMPPSPPGTIDSLRVVALDPETRYGFALRSEDSAGNLSEDSNIVWAQTDSPPPPPPVPPAAIFDLQMMASGIDTARFSWTAPGEDGWIGQARRYHVRLRADGEIHNEEEWQLAEVPDTTGLGRPASAGNTESWTLRGLESATTYALAVRAEDASGLLGQLSNPLVWTTPSLLPPSVPKSINDLLCPATSDTSCDLSWSAPAAGPDQEEAVAYRLVYREGDIPITTEEDWQGAIERSDGLPESGPPGTPHFHRLLGLSPETDYAIALRAVDHLGRLGQLGGAILVMTEAAADTGNGDDPADEPPGALTDLAATAIGSIWVDLAWTAVGENDHEGTADRYELRLLEGEIFLGADDWDRALPCDQILPDPAHAGSRETFRLLDLVAETTYGIALRAFDAAGQISPWDGGIFVEMAGETPDIPLPIQDFAVLDVDPTGVTLGWAHPCDPGTVGGPEWFVVGVAIEPINEENWLFVPKHPDPPDPAAAGTQVLCRWEGLQASTTYWTAVQVESSLGAVSVLSEMLDFTTPPPDLAPPDPPSELRVVQVDEEGYIHLAWDPSASPDVAGYHLYGQSDSGSWSRMNEGMIPAHVTAFAVEATRVAYALTAIDHAGNEGERSESIELTAESFSLNGPFPHPVVESCRFTIEIPLASSSEPLRLRVYDLQGRAIRTVYDDTPGYAGTLEVIWDRSDAAGRKVAPGFYLVTLETVTARIHRRVFVAP